MVAPPGCWACAPRSPAPLPAVAAADPKRFGSLFSPLRLFGDLNFSLRSALDPPGDAGVVTSGPGGVGDVFFLSGPRRRGARTRTRGLRARYRGGFGTGGSRPIDRTQGTLLQTPRSEAHSPRELESLLDAVDATPRSEVMRNILSPSAKSSSASRRWARASRASRCRPRAASACPRGRASGPCRRTRGSRPCACRAGTGGSCGPTSF